MINIEKDFSWSPAGRYKEFGGDTGEEFRDDFLLPALNEDDSVTVNLDGVIGYGSSFLEEAFGGLVREHHLTLEILERKLHFQTHEFPSIPSEIWEYIRAADRLLTE